MMKLVFLLFAASDALRLKSHASSHAEEASRGAELFTTAGSLVNKYIERSWGKESAWAIERKKTNSPDELKDMLELTLASWTQAVEEQIKKYEKSMFKMFMKEPTLKGWEAPRKHVEHAIDLYACLVKPQECNMASAARVKALEYVRDTAAELVSGLVEAKGEVQDEHALDLDFFAQRIDALVVLEEIRAAIRAYNERDAQAFQTACIAVSMANLGKQEHVYDWFGISSRGCRLSSY